METLIKKKKIMILGGDDKSIPVIETAIKCGYEVILCDYNDKLKSIKLANKFYCVSVFDEDRIKEIGKKEEVDGVISYSSDKIAYVANKVARELNLTLNPPESIEILIKKDKFRKFLKDNNFNVPKAIATKNIDENIIKSVLNFQFPIMVKPTDSAGSSGVTKINSINELKKAFEFAKLNSQSQNVIIEEYIEMNHECMIAGDAFVYQGQVKFFGFLNSHRGLKNHPFIPTGTSYPFYMNDKINEIKETIQKVITDLKIDNCPLNLELMYGKDGKLYIIEIAPRNGGNLIPRIILDTYGVDLFKALVMSAVGDIPDLEEKDQIKFATTYVVKSDKDGILKNIEFDKIIKDKIYREVYYKNIGDEILSFDRANKAIGIIFLKFESQDEEDNIIKSIEKYINIEFENK